ncbi:MAG TPA: VOC family protein [Steroidobacteraceae bacterium]|nr:VOC family protein [Steroidobacteraceae bacterium]
MSSSAGLGQFLWHELLTPDPGAGATFYSKAFGWNAQPWEGDANYTMLSHATGPVGGARVVGKDPLADKAGPNWLTYVGVADLAAAISTAESKGGRVIHPVTGVAADGGRYAVITDPQGAAIGLYEAGAGMTDANAAQMAGPAAWHELTAEDPVAALQFYKALFGWEVLNTHPMGGEVGDYLVFGTGSTQLGGAFKRSRDHSGRPRWLVYIHVPSVTAGVASVLAAGGKVLNGPHQVPGGDWIAQVADAQGVQLAIHGPKDAAAAAPKARAKPKAKAAAKPKAKTKTKAKKKAAKKAKSKTQAKRKAAPKRKVARAKVKTRGKVKTKAKAKAKAKGKGKAKTKGRKAARRGK